MRNVSVSRFDGEDAVPVAVAVRHDNAFSVSTHLGSVRLQSSADKFVGKILPYLVAMYSQSRNEIVKLSIQRIS